jgi:hypothetical protein
MNMTLIKYIGYWGSTDNTAEDEAVGLVPGRKYTVDHYINCCEDDDCTALQPMVRNEAGKLVLLLSQEYVESNEGDK